jgi:hypothetical protein
MIKMTEFITSERSRAWFFAASILGLVLFGLALSTMMLPYSRIIEERSSQDLTCLHVPFTQARAAAIIDDYDSAARAAARSLHFPGDTLFPLGYALMYGGLIGLIVNRQEGVWLRVGAVVIFFPFVAMVFDWIENLFILRMLAIATSQSTSAIPGWLPLFGGIAGSIKYVVLSVLAPLYGIAAIVRSFAVRQTAVKLGLVVLDLVAAAWLVFNVYRLVSEVLPCFGGF